MKSNFISNATKKTASKQNQHSNIQEELSGLWTVRQNRTMAKKSMMISAASAQVEKKKKKLTSPQMTPSVALTVMKITTNNIKTIKKFKHLKTLGCYIFFHKQINN